MTKAETIIDTNPETHTKAENEVIDDYVNSVDDSLVAFYQETKADGFKTTKRHKIGAVSDRQAEDIKRETGIDVHGFSNAINNVGAEHIEIRHGENGKADQSMANIEDVGRIGYVLDNYDNAEVIKDSDGNVKLTGAYSDRNMKAVPMVKFSKKVNGTFYVVEAIPDSSLKKIWVQSAYIQKQDPRTRFTADKQSASAPRSADPVKESISETVQKSNIKSVLSSMPGADMVDAASMKAFVDAYDGSISPETYAQGMIWGWHAGNAGSTVEYARSNKAFASLPAKLQAQAHYAGENYGSNTIEGIERQLNVLMDTQARLPDSDAEAIDRYEDKITALRSKLKQLKSVDEVREETYYSTGKEFAREFSGDVYTGKTGVPAGYVSNAIMQGNAHIHSDGRTGHVYSSNYKFLFDVDDDNSVTITDVIDLDDINIHGKGAESEYGRYEAQTGNSKVNEETSLGGSYQGRRGGRFNSGSLAGAEGSAHGLDGAESAGDAGRDYNQGERSEQNSGQVGTQKSEIRLDHSKQALEQKVREHQMTLDEYAQALDSPKAKTERQQTVQLNDPPNLEGRI